eukprot:scaffold53340_cov43-Phaeocystis_antarctica.AAC.1
MKTSWPVDARLWTAGEDPGLPSELGAEYTRPTGGCHEHAARFVPLAQGKRTLPTTTTDYNYRLQLPTTTSTRTTVNNYYARRLQNKRPLSPFPIYSVSIYILTYRTPTTP